MGISILHDDQHECDKDEYDEQQQQHQQHWIKIQCMEQALIQRLIQGFLQLIVPSGVVSSLSKSTQILIGDKKTPK